MKKVIISRRKVAYPEINGESFTAHGCIDVSLIISKEIYCPSLSILAGGINWALPGERFHGFRVDTCKHRPQMYLDFSAMGEPHMSLPVGTITKLDETLDWITGANAPYPYSHIPFLIKHDSFRIKQYNLNNSATLWYLAKERMDSIAVYTEAEMRDVHYTYIIPRPVSNRPNEWVPILNITTDSAANNYYGLDFLHPIAQKELEIILQHHMCLEINPPVKSILDKSLWLTCEGDVYHASCFNPKGDSDKKLVLQRANLK